MVNWSVVEIMELFECKGRGNEENDFLRKAFVVRNGSISV